jgi:hypothetical protein
MDDLNNPFLDKLELDAREHDSERFDVIQSYQNSNTSGLSRYIPDERVPEGKVIGWITEYINGILDRDNMRAMLKRGWQPCPAEMFPEFISIPMPEDRAYQNYDYEYIRDKGGLLCMMDKKLYHILQNEYLHEDKSNNIGMEQRLYNNPEFLGAPVWVQDDHMIRAQGNHVIQENMGPRYGPGQRRNFGF